MAILMLKCKKCGKKFSSGISMSSGSLVTLKGNKSQCPHCRTWANVPDGNFKTIVEPTKKEKKVFKSLEVELLNQVMRAINGHKYVEAYILLWTSIEQFMLPALMGFIARNLKLNLPSKFNELPISQVTKLYYFISHDRKLFLEVEKIRKSRNKLIHKMYKEKSWKDIKAGFKKGTKEMSTTLELLRDRLDGTTPIPSLQLYRNGWNDALNKLKERIESEI